MEFTIKKMKKKKITFFSAVLSGLVCPTNVYLRPDVMPFFCPLLPHREEELAAASEVPEGPERRRVQHTGERVVEADYPSGSRDGDDGGPQAVGRGPELNTDVWKLHH